MAIAHTRIQTGRISHKIAPVKTMPKNGSAIHTRNCICCIMVATTDKMIPDAKQKQLNSPQNGLVSQGLTVRDISRGTHSSMGPLFPKLRQHPKTEALGCRGQSVVELCFSCVVTRSALLPASRRNRRRTGSGRKSPIPEPAQPVRVRLPRRGVAEVRP